MDPHHMTGEGRKTRFLCFGGRTRETVLRSHSASGRGMIAKLVVGREAKHIDFQFVFA